MFTGIVEETGVLRTIAGAGRAGEISVRAKRVMEGTRIGDSISVNGVCLTVTRILPDGFAADVMPETIRRSSLGRCQAGDRVNLERAMPADGRFGGHIVSGHIDGTGTVLSVDREANAIRIRIGAGRDILRLVVEKGSVAIDGISLTVVDVDEESFSVSIIPHTAEETTLGERRSGDPVNLETDIVGKYVERLLGGGGRAGEEGGITMDMLRMLED